MKLIQLGKHIPADHLGHELGKFILGDECVPDDTGRIMYDCCCQNCGFSGFLFPEEMLEHICMKW